MPLSDGGRPLPWLEVSEDCQEKLENAMLDAGFLMLDAGFAACEW